MYKKVSTNMDFVSREREVLAFWKENRIFEKSIELSEGKPEFTFYDGPPTANGMPHIGHVLTRTYKDIIPRYKTMKGYNVLRKAGWDTHGLPVELEVEKMLGLNGKKQIETYGIEAFNKSCRESVWKYKGEWEKMSDAVGYWADMEDPYITYDNKYIESVWWSLKTIWDKGLIYKGYRILPYCPRCGTALASHEVAQGYKDVTENTIIVRFRVKNENAWILAWTTTPWTLPSNVALCVNKDEDYVRAEKNGEVYILAKALAEKVLGEDAKIIATFKGEELVGTEYEPLFPYANDKNNGNAWKVVEDGYVTLEDGTGIVHIAPAFGEDDARVGRRYDLPFVQMVDTSGHFIEGTDYLYGKFVKGADADIIEDLTNRGHMVQILPHTHSYPFCWRCDTPLLYYAREGWFLRTTAIKDELIASNRSINWMPENIKEGRMGNFLENLIDWNISRERYWGTPIPIWQCSCGHNHAVGSVEELRSLGVNIGETIELHRPYIDEVTFPCPKCGKPMHRVTDVLDCWYDSGSMPFAQWHYPFENKEKFEARFPADYISEAIDQTRGWFYTQLVLSTLLFGCSSFKNCIVLGHVNDKEGRKMSKHLGNSISPWEALDSVGADAVRWYFIESSAPWIPNRFSLDAARETQRKFMGTLWNTYAFYILYADIDGFDPCTVPLDESALTQMDIWLRSKTHGLIKKVDALLADYKATEAARAIEGFTDELSNWYLRRSRARYWGSEMTPDKAAAYHSLYNALLALIKLAAPFTPFIAEEIYQNIVRSVDKGAPESIHFCAFPEYNEGYIDAEMESEMDITESITSISRAARNQASIKIRQPLARLYVQGAKVAPEYEYIIREELNVKEVVFTDDARDYLTYSLKPQLRTVGRKFGKLVPALREALANIDGNAAMDALEAGSLKIEVEGQMLELLPEDVLSERVQKEGYTAATEKGISCVLDTKLTPELIAEGYVREIVSKVQNMRKEADFVVTDHISIAISAEADVEAAIRDNAASICGDTLADRLDIGSVPDSAQEWDINGRKAKIAIEKL